MDVEVNFIYIEKQTKIACKENECLKKLFKIFENRTNILNKNLIYLFNGNKINDENITVGQMTDGKTFNILVYDEDNVSINRNIKAQSPEVICPECKCNAFLTMKDFKFDLTCNENGHIFKDILIKNFIKTQEIDFSKIKCKFCKNKNIKNINNNNILRCSICKMDICPYCNIHDNNHKLINYNERNYICSKHNEIYMSFCKTCKKNICMICKKNHNNKHEIIIFDDIIIKEDNIIKGINDIKKEIDEFIDKTNEKIKKLSIIKENMEEYYKIINGIINNYIKNKKINYQILKNIKEIIEDNNIINEIKEINKDNKYDKINIIYNYLMY